MAALADHLGVERFAAMGLSSGGPYALVSAALLAGRMAGAGVVAGVTDMAWAPAWDGYEENEAALMRIGDEAEAAAWCEERYGRYGSRFIEESSGELAHADIAMLEDPKMAPGLITTVGEAFRQGVDGYAQDITVQGRGWSFDPGAVAAPVWVLHGEADRSVPLAHARHTARVIPTATLLTWPDHGHLSIFGEIRHLAADLVATLH